MVVLFVIPIQVMTLGHIFEIYTIVAEIDNGMDLVFGFKNMTETEGRQEQVSMTLLVDLFQFTHKMI